MTTAEAIVASVLILTDVLSWAYVLLTLARMAH